MELEKILEINTTDESSQKTEKINIFRSSHWRCSVTEDVLRTFAKFTGKSLRPVTFIKKTTLAQVFSFEFCEISKNTFFTEQLRATTSVSIFQHSKITNRITLSLYWCSCVYNIKNCLTPILWKRHKFKVSLMILDKDLLTYCFLRISTTNIEQMSLTL